MGDSGLDPYVRQEAEWRAKELNAAYGQLHPGLSTAPPTQAWPAQAQAVQSEPPQAESADPDGADPDSTAPDSAVLNPDDEPLWDLPESPRGFDANRFWEYAGVEPVMIRIGESTGLTLATPSIHDDDERVVFLSDDQGIHLARSVEGLIDLAREIGPWRELASMITPEHVVVLPEYMFDLSEAIEHYANDSADWDPSLLTGVYNFAYEMALHLDIDEVVEALMPGSALYMLYGVVRGLDDGGGFAEWRARQGIAKFDLADVFEAWCDIHDILADHIEWHP